MNKNIRTELKNLLNLSKDIMETLKNLYEYFEEIPETCEFRDTCREANSFD